MSPINFDDFEEALAVYKSKQTLREQLQYLFELGKKFTTEDWDLFLAKYANAFFFPSPYPDPPSCYEQHKNPIQKASRNKTITWRDCHKCRKYVHTFYEVVLHNLAKYQELVRLYHFCTEKHLWIEKKMIRDLLRKYDTQKFKVLFPVKTEAEDENNESS